MSAEPTRSFDRITSFEDLQDYLYNTEENEVVNEKDTIIQYISQTLLNNETDHFGKPNIHRYILNEINTSDIKINLYTPYNSNRKYQEQIDRENKIKNQFAKLLGFIDKDTINWFHVFMRAIHSNIPCGEISIENAVECACQAGENLKKMDLTLFSGDSISTTLLEKLIKFCPNIKSFTLGFVNIVSPWYVTPRVDIILQLNQLEELTVRNQSLTVENFTRLAALENLKKLDIYSCSTCDNFFQILAGSKSLNELIIAAKVSGYVGYQCHIGNEGLKHLEECATLTKLDIGNQNQVTQEAVESLQKALPNLQIVRS